MGWTKQTAYMWAKDPPPPFGLAKEIYFVVKHVKGNITHEASALQKPRSQRRNHFPCGPLTVGKPFELKVLFSHL